MACQDKSASTEKRLLFRILRIFRFILTMLHDSFTCKLSEFEMPVQALFDEAEKKKALQKIIVSSP